MVLNINVRAELAARRIRLPYLMASILNHVPRMIDVNPESQYLLQTELSYFALSLTLASLATFSIENFIIIRLNALKKQPNTVYNNESKVSWKLFVSVCALFSS